MPLSPETGSDGTIAATARETPAEGREVARAAREMGCEFGKSPVVTSVHDEPEAEVTGFSDTQIDTIRSTWPLLSNESTRVGVDVFVRIFTEAPTILSLFCHFK